MELYLYRLKGYRGGGNEEMDDDEDDEKRDITLFNEIDI
jgi:hypothetical protein